MCDDYIAYRWLCNGAYNIIYVNLITHAREHVLLHTLLV
jgi:hypothetical protein